MTKQQEEAIDYVYADLQRYMSFNFDGTAWLQCLRTAGFSPEEAT